MYFAENQDVYTTKPRIFVKFKKRIYQYKKTSTSAKIAPNKKREGMMPSHHPFS